MGYKKTDKCIKKAYDDERLFVLMARDPAAPKVILHWIAKSFETQPADKLREAFACAQEMQERGQEFRDRKAIEEKEAFAAKERDEFDRWKKSREGGIIESMSGKAIVRDGERGLDVMSHGEALDALKYQSHTVGKYEGALNGTRGDVVGFGLRFAQWLKENVKIGSGQTDYESLYKSFLNSLPSTR